MTSSRTVLRWLGALALMAALAGCVQGKDPGYQGYDQESDYEAQHFCAPNA